MAKKCPICGFDDWGIDYIGPDEMPVPECNECGWPGPGPRSVEEAKADYEAQKAGAPLDRPDPFGGNEIAAYLPPYQRPREADNG